MVSSFKFYGFYGGGLLFNLPGGVLDMEEFEDADGLGWIDLEEFALGVDAIGVESMVKGGFDFVWIGDAAGEFDGEGKRDPGCVELGDARVNVVAVGAADLNETGHRGVGEDVDDAEVRHRG